MAIAREYHADANARYVLPNDNEEHTRLEEQARQFKAMVGGDVVHAPVHSSNKDMQVLDVGCGTGYVTRSLALRLPNARVFGLDLSPVPLPGDRVPNVQYLQGNFMTEAPTTWRSGVGESKIEGDEEILDYLYSRLLVGGMDDWPGYIRKCFSLIKPGGWLEIHDLDSAIFGPGGEEVSKHWDWSVKWAEAYKRRGLDFSCGRNIGGWLQEARFINVEVKKYELALGGYDESMPGGREFGAWWLTNVLGLVRVIINKLSEDGYIVEDAKEKMLKQAERDILSNTGLYMDFYVVIGQKTDA